MVSRAGVSSLWLGMRPMMLRDAPGLGAWYGTFEGVRRGLLPAGSDPSRAPVWVTLTAGATAGVAFWVFAFPQDTIKNVIQTRGMDMRMNRTATVPNVAGAPPPPVSLEGFFATGARLVREEGWRRLWRGFPVAALRGIPGASSTFLTYQLVINKLNEW
jgi:solute carrier family 25 carnitine/acylcarnitine transporter 20/29